MSESLICITDFLNRPIPKRRKGKIDDPIPSAKKRRGHWKKAAQEYRTNKFVVHSLSDRESYRAALHCLGYGTMILRVGKQSWFVWGIEK